MARTKIPLMKNVDNFQTPEGGHPLNADYCNTLKSAIEETAYLGKDGDQGSDLKNNIVTFPDTNDEENIKSGETLKILFGKCKKWFARLGRLAFKDTISTEDINSEQITTENIADGAVTNDKISPFSGTKIENDTITSDKIVSLETSAKISGSVPKAGSAKDYNTRQGNIKEKFQEIDNKLGNIRKEGKIIYRDSKEEVKVAENIVIKTGKLCVIKFSAKNASQLLTPDVVSGIACYWNFTLPFLVESTLFNVIGKVQFRGSTLSVKIEVYAINDLLQFSVKTTSADEISGLEEISVNIGIETR